MGATSALRLREAVDRAERVVAIEALCAAQGLDFRAPLKPGTGVSAAHAVLRDRVSHLDTDRPPSPDIEALRELIHAGDLLANGATQAAHG
jgi:histidine ammonia-lyase